MHLNDLPASAQRRVRAQLRAIGDPGEAKSQMRSKLESAALAAIRRAELPEPESEVEFCPGRKWRFDFAWPDEKIAIEVQGGTWSAGRHVRGAGYEGDCIKLAAAQILGWTVIYATERMIERGQMVAAARAALGRMPALASLEALRPLPKPYARRNERAENTTKIYAALEPGDSALAVARRVRLSWPTCRKILRILESQGKVSSQTKNGRTFYWRVGA